MELQEEIKQLQAQKEKLISEIEDLESKLSIIHSGKVKGKITLPCQTQIGIEPEWHLKTAADWSIQRIKIIAILSMNNQNGRFRQWSNQIDTGYMRFSIDPNQHVIELYDKSMFNPMTFD